MEVYNRKKMNIYQHQQKMFDDLVGVFLDMLLSHCKLSGPSVVWPFALEFSFSVPQGDPAFVGE